MKTYPRSKFKPNEIVNEGDIYINLEIIKYEIEPFIRRTDITYKLTNNEWCEQPS